MKSIVILLSILSILLSPSSSSSSSDLLCTESTIKSSIKEYKSIKVVIDEGKNGRRTMIACAYDIDSIEREATYFCETYSSKLGQDHCKNHIARLLREKFREKSSRCESIFQKDERSSEVLATFPIYLSVQDRKIHVPFRANDDVSEFINRICSGNDEQCVAELFGIMFTNPKTRARVVDAFIASCDENTVPSSYDLSDSFVSSSLSQNRIVDEALPRSVFCLLATESVAAFTMMSTNRRQAISHFLKLSDLYRRGPRSGIELAVEHLLHLDFPNEEDRENIVGVEWWFQHRVGNMIVPFHFDKDEGYTVRESAATMKHPSLSTVTYITSHSKLLSKTVPQNPTLVFNTKQHDKTLNLDAFVIPPVANRHVNFPGDLFHGVPDTVSQIVSVFSNNKN